MAIKKDITVLKFVFNETDFNILNELKENFETVIAIYPENKKLSTEKSGSAISYLSELGRVNAINKALKIINTPWILYLNEGEAIDSFKLIPENGNVYAASIKYHNTEKSPFYKYEIRLFPVHEEILLNGFDLPDLYELFQKNNWELSEQVLEIQQPINHELLQEINPDKEIEQFPVSSRARLIKAIELISNQETKKAIGYFRQALQKKNMFKFDYTATLNGLSDALVEQNQWEEAKTHVEISLLEESRQRMPYLVLYKIAQLKRNWKDAISNLEKYLIYHDQITKTNYDVYLKKDECHYLIADAAFRDGDYQQALKHYEQYYILNDGNIDREILKKLFIYSIELSDYDHSVQYFMDMFGAYIPDLLSDENYKLMQEALSLFIKKGWIELPCDIYEQLYEQNPDDEKILHHWVAALIKAKKVKKAQRLLAIARKKVS